MLMLIAVVVVVVVVVVDVVVGFEHPALHRVGSERKVHMHTHART